MDTQHTHWNFLSRYSWVFLLISLIFLIISTVSLGLYQFRLGVDFSGGSVLDVSFQDKSKLPQTADEVRVVAEDVSPVERVSLTDANVTMRLPSIDETKKELILDRFTEKFGEVEEKRFLQVGASIGQELVRKTAIALILALVGSMVYLAVRFQSLSYGTTALLAVIHDGIILLGAFSLFGKLYGVEIDILFVTALLTTVSFSLHDTVVVFDRVRERQKRRYKETLTQTIDHAVEETLVRSIRNSTAILLLLVALLLLGGSTLRWFGVALFIGTVSGTYSSTFVALPLLVLWEKIKKKRGK